MPSERDYAERLREQAYKTLSPQIKDLEQELKELSDSLSSGIYQIERKLEAVNNIELPTTEIVLEEMMEDVLRQKEGEEQSLASFGHDIKQKETQEEILGLLLDYVHGFSPRVALFTVRNDRFAGWSSRGYSEEAARDIAGFNLPEAECPQFQEAMNGEDIIADPDLSAAGSLSFIQSESAGARYLAPLYVLQRPVALLYAEEPQGQSSHSNAISIFTNLTVLSLENIALKILFALTGEKTAPVPQPPPEPQEVESTPEPEPQVQEPPAAVEPTEVAAEPESEPEQAEEASPSPIPPPDDVTPLEQEAGPEPAPETDEPAQEMAAAEAETEEDKGEAPDQETVLDTDEENLHADAKRFARLLVSEIKLYNENLVLEGRENHDLYTRLQRDIDKSREMYENRVQPTVSQKIDYFHDEIVRILGDNDPSTLGSDYPGPRVG